MDSLIGTIGVNDVEDCGELTIAALSKYSFLDPARVGVSGGSHGGFLTGWLIGHPLYKHLYSAACLWNAVLNMNYMLAATDIPDWIIACVHNKPLDWSLAAHTEILHERSPISQVQNVSTPALFLVGDADLRVPPHQSYQFYNILQTRGVKSRLHNYPGDNHSLMKTEHGIDANLNICLWLDEHLIAPFE